MTLPLDEQLSAAQLALDNALNQPEILAALADYRYDAARLNEGKTLFTQVQDLHALQKALYGRQYAATEAFHNAWNTAKDVYMDYVTIARLALKTTPAALLSLGLNGKRKIAFAGWITEALLFYDNAAHNEDISNALAEFGLIGAKLAKGRALVEAVVDANGIQEQAKGSAQAATLKRDEALAALNAWLGDFRRIAKIALKGKEQLLGSLGF